MGLFDSGVGGLSVLRAVRRELPHEDLIYFADQKYCPYGSRPVDEIRARSIHIVEFLRKQYCKTIVVACNTASAAALNDLRADFPDLPIIGMEPALKPAALNSRTRRIGVLATTGTLRGELFMRTKANYAEDVEVLIEYPDDWVERVERGDVDSPETEASVRRVIQPWLDAGVDEIALGCTHYPFLAPLIIRTTGSTLSVIDPSAAVARQTERVLLEHAMINPQARGGTRSYFTSGSAAEFARVLEKLLGEKGEVHAAN